MAQEMITFVYKGKDKTGKPLNGEVEAINLNLAKILIRKQGILVSSVKKKPKALFGGSKVKPKDITFFTRQLSTMLRSGVPIAQALEITADGHKNLAFKKMISDIRTDVESGNSLASALSKKPKLFSNLYVNLVDAGELSGSLEGMLDRLATYMEKTLALKSKIKKALMYPISVLVIAFAITIFMLVKIVPVFENLFSSVGGELPALTQKVVAMSEWLQVNWLFLTGFIILFVIGFIQLKKRSTSFSNKFDAFALKVPIFGTLIQKGTMARVSRTLATTYSAGVPLIEALEACMGSTDNFIYKTALEKVKTDVASGQQLAFSMRQTQVFDPLMIQMTAIGEESGTIDEMETKVAEHYETEVDDLVDGLTSMLEPIILVVLGGLVGTLLLALYLPIFQMGDAFG